MAITQSIFGIQSPKFVKGANTYLLDHSVIIKDAPEQDIIMHESILNRHREFVIKGKHWVFEINLLLFKYGVDAQDKYDELKPLERTLVDQLFRRKDGIAIKDSTNTLVKFFIDEITETYLNRWDFPDVLRIRFVSEKYVDMTKSVI